MFTHIRFHRFIKFHHGARNTQFDRIRLALFATATDKNMHIIIGTGWHYHQWHSCRTTRDVSIKIFYVGFSIDRDLTATMRKPRTGYGFFATPYAMSNSCRFLAFGALFTVGVATGATLALISVFF